MKQFSQKEMCPSKFRAGYAPDEYGEKATFCKTQSNFSAQTNHYQQNKSTISKAQSSLKMH